MNILWNFFKRKSYFSIRTKILLPVSGIILLTISFLLYFAVVKYGDKLETKNIDFSYGVINSLNGALNDYFDEITSLTNLAVFNNNIQNFLISERNNVSFNPQDVQPGSVRNMTISNEIFWNAMNMRSDINSVTIVNDFGVRLMSNIFSNNTDYLYDYKNQPWYYKAVLAEGSPVVTGPFIRTYPLTYSDSKKLNVPVFSVSREIQNSFDSTKLGVILVDANFIKLGNICNSINLTNNSSIYIIDSAGKIVFQPDKSNSPNLNANPTLENDNFKLLLSYIDKPKNGAFKLDIDDRQYQIVYRLMDRTDWIIFMLTPYDSLVADANSIKNLIIIVGIICLLLFLSITSIILIRITKPITDLKNYMDLADHGNFDVRAEIKTKDEVGLLANSFNNMLDRIKTLMKQIIVNQEEKRKLELEALQHQINPHFLYNTLDSIIWMAENHDDNIIPMTEALSKLFRISLNRGHELIDFEDELDHVRNYLFIQSMRYTNKFDFEISADSDTLGCKIIKLILQPLVENSIYHGIKNKKGNGHITISAIKENENLVISISDDGIGMTPEVYENILSDTDTHRSSTGSSIGIRNVNERIKLYYGNNYGIRYESTPGIGTTAYITLPLL